MIYKGVTIIRIGRWDRRFRGGFRGGAKKHREMVKNWRG